MKRLSHGLGALLLWCLTPLTAISQPAISDCPAPIRFQAGPFFSQSFANKFWSGFANQIATISGCKVTVHGSQDYEMYLRSLLIQDFDIYVTPDYYAEALIKLGLIPAIRSRNAGEILLVSRVDLSENPSHIQGATIVVPSVYTRAYLDIEKWLKDRDLFDSVTLDSGYTHDGALIKLLNGEADAAAVISNIYRRLPDNIKNRLHHLKIAQRGGGYLFVRAELAPWLKPALMKATAKSTLFSWEIAKPPYFDPHSARFQEQLSAFRAKIENKAK